MSQVHSSERRSSFEITFAVWKALFLREAISRLSARRAAWVWMLVDPLFQISWITYYHSILRHREIGGINGILWVAVGVLAYNMFGRPTHQSIGAISANQGLFVYRQIKPIDTILARCALEGCLMAVISLTLLALANLFGLDTIPDDPLMVFAGIFGLWLIGIGYGMMASVAKELMPEIGKIIAIAMIPLPVVSGMIFPVYGLPEPYRSWLMINPLGHGLEIVRQGFSSYYHVMPETSVLYFYECALVFLFLGIALQIRFADKMVAR